MGIYINKVLGYGIQMTKEEATSILNREVSRRLYNLTGENYLEFLKAKYADADPDSVDYYLNDLHSADQTTMPSYRASDFVTIADTSEEEHGSDNVWVVITPPLVCKAWKHNDNPIDYYEESLKYQDEPSFQLEHKMRFFKHGLFPYDGTSLNHRTGQTVDSSRAGTIRHYIKVTKNESTPAEDKALRLLLASVKVSSVEEFEEVIHPAPPVSVVDIAEWTGIFADSSIAPKLRPCLLQFWR